MLGTLIAGVSSIAAQVFSQALTKKTPPYSGKVLGSDPTKSPGKGFEWKGQDPPGGRRGSWTKGKGQDKESLHPDLNHPAPKKPHWDYDGPQGKARLNTDGTYEWKK